MAAVLTPQHHPGRAQLSTRPQLRALDGGRSEMAARYRRRRIVAGVLALLAVVATWNAVSAVWPTADSAQQVVAGAGSSSGSGASEGEAVGGVVPTASADGASAAGASLPDHVVVRPGDTLWSIAMDLRPEGDVRPLVDELAARAGGGSIQVGQRISLEGILD